MRPRTTRIEPPEEFLKGLSQVNHAFNNTAAGTSTDRLLKINKQRQELEKIVGTLEVTSYRKNLETYLRAMPKYE